MDENETTGLGRRDLLKRGAVVGGALVWATPVVQSMATPAFAASSPNDCKQYITQGQGADCVVIAERDVDPRCCETRDPQFCNSNDPFRAPSPGAQCP